MSSRHSMIGGGEKGPCVGLPLLDHIRAWLLTATQNLNHPLRPRQRTTLMAQLEKAKVEVEYEGHRRQDTVVGVSLLGADRQAVLFPGEEVKRRGLVSIAEYFLQVYGVNLHNPALNCVELRGCVWVPIELVRIISLPNMRGANLYQSSPSPTPASVLSTSPTSAQDSTSSPSTFPTTGTPSGGGGGLFVPPTDGSTPPLVDAGASVPLTGGATAPSTGIDATRSTTVLSTTVATRLVDVTGADDTTDTTVITTPSTPTTVTTTTNTTVTTTTDTTASTPTTPVISTTTTSTPTHSPITSTAPPALNTAEAHPITSLEGRFLLNLRMPTGVAGLVEAEVEVSQPKVSPCQVETMKIHSPVTLRTWALYNYDRRVTTKDLSTFLIHLKHAGRCRGVEVAGPVQLRFSSCHNPLDEMQQLAKTYPGLQLVMVVLDDRAMYGRVKVVGDLCLGVVTQCVLPATVRQLSPAALKNLVRQINTKLGGPHLRVPRIATPPHLAPSLMVMALHHGTAFARIGLHVASVVGSANLSAGQYLTEVQTQTPWETCILDLTNMTWRLLETLTRKYGRPVPEQILVYSDGVDERQAQRIMRKEWAALMTACQHFMSNYRPGITYVAIHGSTLSWFTTDHVERSPVSSSVVALRSLHLSDSKFNICISNDRKSWHPAQYSILNDSSNIPVKEVERFTRALCHLPGTPHSPQSLPCPLIYARQAAFRCHQHMKTLHDNWTQRDYKDLQRDISRLVRVDTSHPIAHQVYYI